MADRINHHGRPKSVFYEAGVIVQIAVVARWENELTYLVFAIAVRRICAKFGNDAYPRKDVPGKYQTIDQTLRTLFRVMYSLEHVLATNHGAVLCSLSDILFDNPTGASRIPGQATRGSVSAQRQALRVRGCRALKRRHPITSFGRRAFRPKSSLQSDEGYFVPRTFGPVALISPQSYIYSLSLRPRVLQLEPLIPSLHL
jgi:hypothetical protein